MKHATNHIQKRWQLLLTHNLKMEVKGTYLDNLKTTDHLLLIQYGKLYRIRNFDSPRFSFFTDLPKDTFEFKLIKLHSEKGFLIPKNCNYKIEYFGKSDKLITFYLNLKQTDIFRIKLQRKEYILQSKEIKTDIIKYVFGGILGFVGGIITHNTRLANTPPEKPPKQVIRKSIDQTYDQTTDKKLKIDSIK